MDVFAITLAQQKKNADANVIMEMGSSSSVAERKRNIPPSCHHVICVCALGNLKCSDCSYKWQNGINRNKICIPVDNNNNKREGSASGQLISRGLQNIIGCVFRASVCAPGDSAGHEWDGMRMSTSAACNKLA